jgi:hypothetical protein
VTCDEFRRRWLDHEPDGKTESTQLSVDLAVHRDGCRECRSWLRQERALDQALGMALIVAPPPDLVRQLAQIPLAAGAPGTAADGVRPLGLFLEAAFLIMVGLGAIGLSAAADSALLGLAIDQLGGFLQALPLVVNPPLVSYAESVAFTLVEAMATLILLALGLLRVGGRWSMGPRTEAGS